MKKYTSFRIGDRLSTNVDIYKTKKEAKKALKEYLKSLEGKSYLNYSVIKTVRTYYTK